MGHNVSMKVAAEGDDWETDPDFEVLVKETSVGAKAPHSVSPPCGFRVSSSVCTLCFRMTCRSRNRGGGPRPSRAQDAKNTSGKKRGRNCFCKRKCAESAKKCRLEWVLNSNRKRK